MSNFEYVTTAILTEEIVKDILTTAIEGGIGYWACLDNGTEIWETARKTCKERLNDTPCYCDVAYEILNTGKEIRFIDAETENEDDPDEDEIWFLTREKFLNGCKLWEQKNGKLLQKVVPSGEFDADDADCLIQYALFDKVVFG